MSYGKIENGEFQAAPINFKTPAGRTICNFHSKPEKLAEYGFLPVETTPAPPCDPETQHAEPVYEPGDGVILQSWVIREGGE